MRKTCSFPLAVRLALAAAFLWPALALLPGEAAAQGTVRSNHGDWQLRCDTPPGAPVEQCALIQSVTAEDRQNVGLTVIILRTADGETQLMRVLAPLGVLLPSGLGLRVDDTDVGRAGFVRCLPNGCVAEVVMEEELIGQLGGGETATFIIFQTPEEGIGIPISLDGFAEGVEALPEGPGPDGLADPDAPPADGEADEEAGNGEAEDEDEEPDEAE